MRFPQAFDLNALSNPDSFRTLWQQATWLGDRQELKRDLCIMQKLLRLMLNAGSIADVRPALDLTLALFLVHADIERALPGVSPPVRSIDYATTLIELLNDTPDDDPLFTVRASSVLHHLSILMSVEEDCYDETAGSSTHAQLSDGLLQRRERLLRDAERLVGATGAQLPAGATLN